MKMAPKLDLEAVALFLAQFDYVLMLVSGELIFCPKCLLCLESLDTLRRFQTLVPSCECFQETLSQTQFPSNVHAPGTQFPGVVKCYQEAPVEEQMNTDCHLIDTF